MKPETPLDDAKINPDMASTAASDEKLCIECSSIDFTTVLNPANRVRSKNGNFVANLGSRLSPSENIDCALCRLFSSIRYPSEPKSEYDLWAYSSLNCSQQFLFRSIQEFLQAYDSIFFAVIPSVRDTGLLDFSAVKRHCWKVGYIARGLDSASMENQFCARIVPPRVNYSLFRSWISWCGDHHYKNCGIFTEYKFNYLKLIDCETNIIVSAESTLSMQYVALSYVWGSPRGHEAVKGNNDKEQDEDSGIPCLPHSLPKVVEDAIIVTRNLGYRYLWVDRYCINQNREEEKLYLVKEMHLIYQGASVTIVAAAGNDGGFGLVGVNDILRESQLSAKVHAGTLVSTLSHPSRRIKESKWSTRGWTYQEAVFSRRRLVFTEDQVYFECKSMNCFESVQMPLEAFHTKDKSRSRHFIRSGIFDGSDESKRFSPFADSSTNYIQPTLLQFMVHVENYSPRQLTNVGDSLNAFRGIMQSFVEEKIPVYSLFGLPFQTAQDVESDIPTTTLLAALCWRHDTTGSDILPSLKKGFPSWSWTGWEGKVHFPLKHHISPIQRQRPHGKFTNAEVSIHLILQNGVAISISDIKKGAYLADPEKDLKPLLRIDAWFLSPAVIYNPRPDTPLVKEPYNILNHNFVSFISEELSEQSAIVEKIRNEEWMCIILGFLGKEGYDSDEKCYILVVEATMKDTYRRIGTIEIEGIGHRSLSNLSTTTRHKGIILV